MKRVLFYFLSFISITSSSYAQIISEAEEGVLQGTTIETSRAGFSGTGYVSGFDNSGDKLTVSLSVPEQGTYDVRIKYAIESGFGSKTNDVYIDGEKFAEHIFVESPTFSEANVGAISLSAGEHEISIVHNWGYFDVDYISLVGGSNGGANTAPVAKAGSDLIVMDVDMNGSQQVTISGIQSSDDEEIVTYEWRTTEGSIIEANNDTLETNLSLGVYEFILKVTDSDGATAEDRVKVYVADPTNGGKNRLPLRNGSEDVFVSGINLAWDDFANDLDVFDETFFTKVFDDIESAGGNALRWWLHTNGRNSPTFDGTGKVKGIDLKEIVNMRKALDLAYERGIVISMCLWSFDMLQNQGQNQAHMKLLVEDKTRTQTYIDNALIPILAEIGNHPAVMTWEIFNEGEGMTSQFGWADQRTEMKYVQQFVNLLAGAIHRHAPGALVSNSGWSFKAGTDIEGNLNYYRDDRLIAAGGDELGTLDFYQIHYYPEHFGNEYSPFHRPASHWQLDKPIVIGEFPVSKIEGKADPYLSTTEAYKRAFEYGYAGVLSWSYTGFNGGDFSDAIDGMTYLRNTYPSALALSVDENRNTPPDQTGLLPEVRVIAGSTALLEDVVDLDDFFFDEEDGDELTFLIADDGNGLLAVPTIDDENRIDIAFVEGATGKSEIVLQARDTEGYSSWAMLSLSVQEQDGNLALFRDVSVSSTEEYELRATQANDGDMTTRWSSIYEDEQHITIDLGAGVLFDRVKLHWETAYGKSYDLLVSTDSANWTTVFSETSGNGGEDDISIDPVEGRYLRVAGKTRGTAYGFSLWEIQVFSENTTAVESTEDVVMIDLYPNPTNKFLRLKTERPALNSRLIVLDQKGNQILTTLIRNNTELIDVHDWRAGLYVFHFLTTKGKVSRKIMIQ